jgi:hypothetical protein
LRDERGCCQCLWRWGRTRVGRYTRPIVGPLRSASADRLGTHRWPRSRWAASCQLLNSNTQVQNSAQAPSRGLDRPRRRGQPDRARPRLISKLPRPRRPGAVTVALARVVPASRAWHWGVWPSACRRRPPATGTPRHMPVAQCTVTARGSVCAPRRGSPRCYAPSPLRRRAGPIDLIRDRAGQPGPQAEAQSKKTALSWAPTPVSVGCQCANLSVCCYRHNTVDSQLAGGFAQAPAALWVGLLLAWDSTTVQSEL